jgi:undecaprenyl-diphosphatase
VASIINYILIGLIQGVLEWLPISSQGNLIFLMVSVLGFDPKSALNLSFYLHFGTGLAALFFFRREFIRVISWKSQVEKNFFFFLLISTLVTGLVGLPLYFFISMMTSLGETILLIIGFALITTGLIQSRTGMGGDKTSKHLRNSDGLIIGLFQGFSVVPGVSRSGLTSSILLLKKFSGSEAFRISFIMSVPTTFAATLGLLLIEGIPSFQNLYLIAIFSSFISGMISIGIIIKIIKKIRSHLLCIILGVLMTLFQLFNIFL